MKGAAHYSAFTEFFLGTVLRHGNNDTFNLYAQKCTTPKESESLSGNYNDPRRFTSLSYTEV